MPATYPDVQDVERVIRSLGLFNAEELAEAILDLGLEEVALAAAREWEDMTGWIPFETADSDTTRYYDPPGPNAVPEGLGGRWRLQLDAPLTAVTSVRVGYSPENTVGTLLTLNTDFYLYPYNAQVAGRPWTAIEFRTSRWGARRSIQIVGRFGYSATIPDDAWLAIARRAASLALPEIATRISGGRTEFTEAGVTERFGAGFLTGGGSGSQEGGGVGGAWQREWERVVLRYRKVSV